MEKKKYVEEMLKEMREQFDFDKEQEEDLIKAIGQEYEEMLKEEENDGIKS